MLQRHLLIVFTLIIFTLFFTVFFGFVLLIALLILLALLSCTLVIFILFVTVPTCDDGILSRTDWVALEDEAFKTAIGGL